jgi:hypothetical protein
MPAELARLFLYITHSHRRAFMQRSFRLAVQQSDGENGFLKVDLPQDLKKWLDYGTIGNSRGS